jgi:hypothetical protein
MHIILSIKSHYIYSYLIYCSPHTLWSYH